VYADISSVRVQLINAHDTDRLTAVTLKVQLASCQCLGPTLTSHLLLLLLLLLTMMMMSQLQAARCLCRQTVQHQQLNQGCQTPPVTQSKDIC